MKYDFNLNEEVKVRLTPRGERIYRAYYDKIVAAIRVHNPDFKRTGYMLAPPTDGNGHVVLQLWVLMAIFGPELSMAQEPPFLDNLLRFDAKDLKKVPA